MCTHSSGDEPGVDVDVEARPAYVPRPSQIPPTPGLAPGQAPSWTQKRRSLDWMGKALTIRSIAVEQLARMQSNASATSPGSTLTSEACPGATQTRCQSCSWEDRLNQHRIPSVRNFESRNSNQLADFAEEDDSLSVLMQCQQKLEAVIASRKRSRWNTRNSETTYCLLLATGLTTHYPPLTSYSTLPRHTT